MKWCYEVIYSVIFETMYCVLTTIKESHRKCGVHSTYKWSMQLCTSNMLCGKDFIKNSWQKDRYVYRLVNPEQTSLFQTKVEMDEIRRLKLALLANFLQSPLLSFNDFISVCLIVLFWCTRFQWSMWFNNLWIPKQLISARPLLFKLTLPLALYRSTQTRNNLI